MSAFPKVPPAEESAGIGLSIEPCLLDPRHAFWLGDDGITAKIRDLLEKRKDKVARTHPVVFPIDVTGNQGYVTYNRYDEELLEGYYFFMIIEVEIRSLYFRHICEGTTENTGFFLIAGGPLSFGQLRRLQEKVGYGIFHLLSPKSFTSIGKLPRDKNLGRMENFEVRFESFNSNEAKKLELLPMLLASEIDFEFV